MRFFSLLCSLLLPVSGWAASELTLSVGSFGSVKATTSGSPPVVVLKTATSTLFRAQSISPKEAHDPAKPPQIRAYSLANNLAAVSFRFALKDGGEDIVIAAQQDQKLVEIVRETTSSEPGIRVSVLDINGDGNQEILLYRTDELAILCDGERARISAKVYQAEQKTFTEIELPPLGALGTPLLPTTFTPPSKPSTSIAPFRASSSREGFEGVTSVADILSDEDPETAWVEGRQGPGIGEFATAALRGNRMIVAVGLQTAKLTGVESPSSLLLALGNGSRGTRLKLTIPVGTAPGATLWYKLPAPAPASCASVIFAEASGARNGLAGVRLVSLQELSPKEALKAFLEDLGGADFEKASGALEGIVALPAGVEIDDELAKISTDPTEKMARRSAALTALERRGAVSSNARAAYAAALRSENALLQKAAKLALVHNKTISGTVLSEALLQAPTPIIAQTIQEAIEAGLDPKLVLPALVERLGSGDKQTRQSIRAALSATHSLAAPEMIAKLSSTSLLARADAARVLGALFGQKDAGKAAVEALSLALQKEVEFEARYAMVAALGAAPSTEHELAAQALSEVLKNEPEEIIRARAATAYSALSSVSMAPVEAALLDQSPMVRAAAVKGLGLQGAQSAAPALANVLKSDKWDFVRVRAAYAAAAISTPETDAALLGAIRDPSKQVGIAAIIALRGVNRKSAAPTLRKLVLNEKAGRERRVEAAYALGELGSEEDAAALLQCLQQYRIAAGTSEGAEDLAVACALSLATLRYSKAYDELELMVLEGPGPIIQKTGVRALGILCDPRSIPLLQKAVSQKEDPILSKVAKEAQRCFEQPK